MVTCRNCGAENKDTAVVCRLCALPLEDANSRMERGGDLPPTIVVPNPTSPQSAAGPGEIACPTCNTMNEVGWAFCQQCGSKLPQTSQKPAPPASEPKKQMGQVTIVAQPPGREPNMPMGMPTVVDQPPLSEPKAPPGPPREFSQPPAPQRPAQPVNQQGQPPAAAQPPQRDMSIPPGKQTVPEQSPRVPPPPAQRFNPPPASSPVPPSTEQVQSTVPGVPCQQCGHMNTPGSAFCAACGKPLMVAKTIVMSSVTAPPKGRLHLIMEGGQQGEVYELGDETAIGRSGGDISFPHDGFMSGRHARIVRRDDSFILMDEGSRNGTFIKINEEVELKSGDMILIGKQLFRFEV